MRVAPEPVPEGVGGGFEGTPRVMMGESDHIPKQQFIKRSLSAVSKSTVLKSDDKPVQPKLLVLKDVLQDAFEYDGLTRMAWFLLYFTFTIIFTGFNWSENQAYFHSEVLNSLQAYGPTDWQNTMSANQLSMGAAFDYVTGYVSQNLKDAEERQLPPQQLAINQYIQVQLLRLVVDVETSCFNSRLSCYHDDPAADKFGYDPTNINILPSNQWQLAPSPPTFAYGTGDFMYITLYNRTDSNATYADLNATMTALAADSPFIGRYAVSLHLEMVALNTMEWEHNSTVYFSLYWTLKNYPQSKGFEIDAFHIRTSTATIPMKTSFLASFWDLIRLIMLLVYISFILTYLAEEIDELRLSALQYRVAAENQLQAAQHSGQDILKGLTTEQYKSKMVRLAAWRYLTSPWNLIDIFSTLLSFIWAFGWVYVIMIAAANKSTFEAYMDSPTNLHALMDFSEMYAVFIYVGILNVLLVGLRLYKYMRFHSGLRVYYNLFIQAWRAIRDFGLWFIYVMLVLASTVIMVFQVSGGNELFSIRADGINSMALVTFGLLDYQTFVNKAQGMGSWGPVVISLFWMNTAILGTIALNIIIAIVGNAYTDAKAKEGPVEHTLLYIIWLRLHFYALYIKRVWLQHWPLERFVQSWVRVVCEEINRDPGAVMHDFRYTKKYSWVTLRNAKIYARWGIALLPETKALLAYFMDASNTMLCARSPWEDGEAVEEALVAITVTNRRHKLRTPDYKWSTNTAMKRADFMAFMIALASSGSAGLLHDDDALEADEHGDAHEPSYEPVTDQLLQQCKAYLNSTKNGKAPTSQPLWKRLLCCCCTKSSSDVENGCVTGSDGNTDQDQGSAETCRHLDHGGFLELADTLGRDLVDLDQLNLDNSEKASGAQSGKQATGFVNTALKKPSGNLATDTPANATYSIRAWNPEGVTPAFEPRSRSLSALLVRWQPLVSLWQGRRADMRPVEDLECRDTAGLFTSGWASLLVAFGMRWGLSDTLTSLLQFRPMFGLQKSRLSWRQPQVARHYASWIWEIYSANMYGDEDWAEDLDDMDLKILDLKTELAGLIETKIVHQNTSIATRPCSAERVSRQTALLQLLQADKNMAKDAAERSSNARVSYKRL